MYYIDKLMVDLIWYFQKNSNENCQKNFNFYIHENYYRLLCVQKAKSGKDMLREVV